MTSVNSTSALLALATDSTDKNKNASQTDAIFELVSQVNQTNSKNSSGNGSGMTSGAVGMSSAAFGALFGGSDGSDPLDALFGDSEDSTGGIGDIFAAIAPTGSSLSNEDYDFLYGSGPLPTFLAGVKTQMNLSPEKAQALDSIALHFKNAQDTPETVSQIAAALSQAGITA